VAAVAASGMTSLDATVVTVALPQTAELDPEHLAESVVDPGAVVPVDPASGVSFDVKLVAVYCAGPS
jgi:hypothetical protein